MLAFAVAVLYGAAVQPGLNAGAAKEGEAEGAADGAEDGIAEANAVGRAAAGMAGAIA